MRKVVLLLGVGLMVAAGLVYCVWWYKQMNFAEMAYLYPSSQSTKYDYVRATYTFAKIRVVSIFTLGLGVILAVIAYTPWVWTPKKSDRG